MLEFFQSYTLLVILTVAIVILQAYDFWSTRKILSKGGQELNPIMDTLIKRIGLVPALVLSKLGVSIAISGLTVYMIATGQPLNIYVNLIYLGVTIFYLYIMLKFNSKSV